MQTETTGQDKASMDFWYELDYLTNAEFVTYEKRDNRSYTNISPQINDAIWNQIWKATLDGKSLFEAYDQFYRSGGEHSPEELKTKLQEKQYESLRSAFTIIAHLILDLMDKHFGGNEQLEQLAFEQFGQGTLFDTQVDGNDQPRRPAEFRIHMMDGSTGGYDFLNKIVNLIDILVLAGTHERWLKFDRYVGLAAEIDSICKPKQSFTTTPIGNNPNNQPIANGRLEELRSKWLNLRNLRDIDAEMQKLDISSE